MERHYTIAGCLITVYFQEGLVRIVSDKALRHLVFSKRTGPIPALINDIKGNYSVHFGKGLAIGDDSFAMEIFGHVYFERFLLRYRKILRVVLFFGLYARLRKSCAVIDCGERGKDPNRHFWDLLAVFRNYAANR